MRFTSTRLQTGSCVLALILAGSPLFASQDSQESKESQQQSDAAASSIEGSWIFTITRTDGTVFTAFQSYTAGGVALGSGSIQTPPTSALHGTWKRARPRHFVHSFDLFIYPPNGGDATNMLKNSIQLNLNREDELVGTGVAVLCDVKGDNCFGIGGITLSGKRIPAE
jgi:hypothetical protein